MGPFLTLPLFIFIYVLVESICVLPVSSLLYIWVSRILVASLSLFGWLLTRSKRKGAMKKFGNPSSLMLYFYIAQLSLLLLSSSLVDTFVTSREWLEVRSSGEGLSTSYRPYQLVYVSTANTLCIPVLHSSVDFFPL